MRKGRQVYVRPKVASIRHPQAQLRSSAQVFGTRVKIVRCDGITGRPIHARQLTQSLISNRLVVDGRGPYVRVDRERAFRVTTFHGYISPVGGMPALDQAS